MLRFKFIVAIAIALTRPNITKSENISKVNFVFYYGAQADDYEIFKPEENIKILQHPQYDSGKRTMCYIHGYTENQNSTSTRTIIEAYLKRLADFNIITLDWALMARGRYIIDAVKNSVLLEHTFGNIFIDFIRNGLDVEKLHIVGHSLGGHLAGFIGRAVQNISNGQIKLSRITALDPAFPGFYIIPLRRPINSNDAHFVDIIHTDGWIYGGPLSTGSVDFWPNRGALTQPGCPKRDFKILTATDLCSHRQSWRYWAESVSNEYEVEFWAAKATSWQDFRIRSQFIRMPMAKMGLDCATNISGNYYLQTNHKAPFARGFDGAVYTNKIRQKYSQRKPKSDANAKYYFYYYY